MIYDHKNVMSELKRPRGVTILAILLIINGGFMVIYLSEFGTPLEIFSQISTIEEAVGVYSYISYFVGFAVAGALLSGKGWGRTIAIILMIIGIVISGVFILWDGSLIFGLIVNIIILWYLRKPHVRSYFGQQESRL